MHERFTCLKNEDYTRLCVAGRKHKGKALYAFCMESGVWPETAIGDYAVFVLTPSDTDEKLERLYQLLQRA